MPSDLASKPPQGMVVGTMNVRTHGEFARFIWSICNLLRGLYKRNEYRKVILPLTVLRRFDCVLAETKQAVLETRAGYRGHGDPADGGPADVWLFGDLGE